ncbi:gamma-glutamyltransferase [Staphylococcus ratti]|uniref:Gamma-glutamyltransferase n=1 Tax=Staphylococcus ratti TaxID=2892440 RepID=A0ABY3PD97_9STAP|nr:gamma-glutamyltransferase [Staphylococcus ratti]UEX90292.1 gamma-glutamyltransferase [Staphylococcus ratti]
MSIYNKKLLGVILIVMIFASIGFYYLNLEEKVDKDQLYENKLASQTKNDNATKAYGISTNNEIARQVGNKILNDGGNSADAAYGVAYTLAVTEPFAAGLGGEGTTLSYSGKKGEQPKVYDYNAISSHNYKKGDTIGVPGFVSGMSHMHDKEGKMSEKDILNYVIPLAEDGFQVNSDLEKMLLKYSAIIDKSSPFVKNGKVLKSGDVVKQPNLANTLKYIRDNGSKSFYTDLGSKIAEQTKGTLDAQDFKAYKTKEKKALSTDYLGNKVYTSPNPTGGILTLQALKLDQMINGELGEDAPKSFAESVVKARNVNYKNRYIVNDVKPIDKTKLNDAYLSQRAEEYKKLKNKFNLQGDTSTAGSHFVVVDKDGKMISSTNTLNNFFGNGKYTEQGFFLNNALDRFSKSPSSDNKGAPNKAPRSYISPMIVVGENYHFGIGTPGGNKIPTLLQQTMSNYLRNKGSLTEIIDKPRFYNDGDKIYYEKGMKEADIKRFKKLGYKVESSSDNPNFGSIQGATYFDKDKKVEIGDDVEVR